MDVPVSIARDSILHRSSPNGHARKKRPAVARPALPPEAEAPFRQLMGKLMSDDLDTRCRTALRVQEIGQPELMHQILYEIQAAVRSRSQAVRDKASTLLYFLGPRLFGFPPQPLSLDELTMRLRNPDPQVRQEAAEAIGDRGEAAKPALGVLRQMLRDPDAKVQYRAAVAIGQLTGSIPEKPRTIEPTEGSDVRRVDEAPE